MFENRMTEKRLRNLPEPRVELPSSTREQNRSDLSVFFIYLLAILLTFFCFFFFYFLPIQFSSKMGLKMYLFINPIELILIPSKSFQLRGPQRFPFSFRGSDSWGHQKIWYLCVQKSRGTFMALGNTIGGHAWTLETPLISLFCIDIIFLKLKLDRKWYFWCFFILASFLLEDLLLI